MRDGNALMPATREEKRAEALRELGLRRRTYPRWVEAGRLSQADADRQIALMQSIADDYADPNLFGDH